MQEFPKMIICPSCGKTAKRKDQQRNGFIILGVGIVTCKFSMESGALPAIIAWFTMMFTGIKNIMTSDRFLYICKHCAKRIDPHQQSEAQQASKNEQVDA